MKNEKWKMENGKWKTASTLLRDDAPSVGRLAIMDRPGILVLTNTAIELHVDSKI
jgi:hypothetical protein